jgi:hypothetical protein
MIDDSNEEVSCMALQLIDFHALLLVSPQDTVRIQGIKTSKVISVGELYHNSTTAKRFEKELFS